MSEQVRKEIGRLLREVRRDRGLGLEDVQALTGSLGWPVSRSRLSMVERGEADLRLSDLYALSRSYGIPVTDLIAESLVAHGPAKAFPSEKTAEELFEEAKRRFREGFPLEAAWAFEEAARRASGDEEKRDFVHLCRVSAGHCYERAGATELALKRVESVVDEAPEHSDPYLRAVAKAASLRARLGCSGRSKLYLRAIDEALAEPKVKGELHAMLTATKAVVVFELGDPRTASRLAAQSARAYRRLGDFTSGAKQAAAAALYAIHGNERDRAFRLARDASSALQEDTELETCLLAKIVYAEVLAARDEPDTARELATEVARMAERHAYEPYAAWAYELLRDIEEAVGHSAVARRWDRKRRRIRVPPRVALRYRPPRSRR